MKFLLVALVVVVVNAVAGLPAPMGSPPSSPSGPKTGVKVVTMEFITEHAKKADEEAGITKREGCPADYCQNGGECVTLNEATFTGRDYVCKCNGDFGGYRCGVARPCLTCPANLGAVYCVPSAIESRGRYCYDKKYQLVDESGKSRNKRLWWLAPLVIVAAAGK